MVENLPGLKQVWICGDLARGDSSGSIDCILIGEELDAEYIAGLSAKVHKLVGKKVNTQVMEEIKDEMVSALSTGLGNEARRMISGFKAALSNSEKQRKVMLVNSDLENLLKEKIA